jgi:hypothetical protein
MDQLAGIAASGVTRGSLPVTPVARFQQNIGLAFCDRVSDIEAVTARPVAFFGDENAGLRSRPSSIGKECAMPIRRRFKQRSFGGGLSSFAKHDGLVRGASRAETALHVEQWANSPSPLLEIGIGLRWV